MHLFSLGGVWPFEPTPEDNLTWLHSLEYMYGRKPQFWSFEAFPIQFLLGFRTGHELGSNFNMVR